MQVGNRELQHGAKAYKTDQAGRRRQGGRRFARHRLQRLLPPRDRARGSARAGQGRRREARLWRPGSRRAGCCAPARSTPSASRPPSRSPISSTIRSRASSCRASARPATPPAPASRWSRPPIEEQLAWNIQSALVDGFIVFCIEGGSRLVELTRERKLPFVALDFGFDDETISAIGVDDVAGARLAARHLAGARPSPLRRAVAAVRRRQPPAPPRSSGPTRRDLFRHARPPRRLFRGACRSRRRYRRDADLRDATTTRRPHGPASSTSSPRQTPPTAILAMSDRMALHRARMAGRARHFGAAATSRSSASTACRRASFPSRR